MRPKEAPGYGFFIEHARILLPSGLHHTPVNLAKFSDFNERRLSPARSRLLFSRDVIQTLGMLGRRCQPVSSP